MITQVDTVQTCLNGKHYNCSTTSKHFCQNITIFFTIGYKCIRKWKKRTKLFLLSMLSFKLVKTLKIKYRIYLFKKKLIKISLVVFAFLSSYNWQRGMRIFSMPWQTVTLLFKFASASNTFFFCFQHFIPYIFSVMKCLQEFMWIFFLLVSLPLGHFYPFIEPLS